MLLELIVGLVAVLFVLAVAVTLFKHAENMELEACIALLIFMVIAINISGGVLFPFSGVIPDPDPDPGPELILACGELLPGSYLLGGDLECGETCFTFASGDVVLDCDGFMLSGAGTGVLISSNSNITLLNCGFEGFESAVRIVDSSNVTIANTTFSDLSFDDDSLFYAIHISGASSEIGVYWNYFGFDHWSQTGVYAGCDPSCSGLLVAENVFVGFGEDDPGYAGIYFENVEGSMIYGNGFNGLQQGIYAFSFYDSFVQDNVFVDIDDSIRYEDTIGLFMIGNNISGECGTGIHFVSDSVNDTILGNVIDCPAGSFAFVLRIAEGTFFADNYVSSEGVSVFLIQVVDSMFRDNVIVTNPTTGTGFQLLAANFFGPCTGNSFYNNSVSGAVTLTDFSCGDTAPNIDLGLNTCGSANANCATWLSSCP